MSLVLEGNAGEEQVVLKVDQDPIPILKASQTFLILQGSCVFVCVGHFPVYKALPFWTSQCPSKGGFTDPISQVGKPRHRAKIRKLRKEPYIF